MTIKSQPLDFAVSIIAVAGGAFGTCKSSADIPICSAIARASSSTFPAPYGHRDGTIILIGYRHGLRASELCDLQWSQIELAGRLHVRRAAIRTFLILAFALVAIASSLAREDNKCYSSCRARCDTRYACRTSCWRMDL